jgi:amino acid transporter
MTTTSLVLTVLAFSSPLTCAAGYFSFVIASSGETAPLAFVGVTLLLLVFSVGYMAMTKRMPRPGAFYAYISSGLGRRIGLGSAFLATVSYTIILMGVYAFVGTVVSGLVTKYGGPTIDWWVGGLLAWVAVGVLGYFNVDISAKVLVWVMLVEVTLVMIFNVAVIVHGGDAGLNMRPFDVGAAADSGTLAISGLFAILVFIGFEATALYRDEVWDPDRTLPRGTYVAVAFIGILYTFTVYAMTMAFGSAAQATAAADPGGMFGIGAERYVGDAYAQVVTILLLTAVLASLVSIHNASTRYLFNLSADGAIPRYFGHAHVRFKSPARASSAISILALLALTPFVVGDSDPGLLYGQLAGLGSTGVIFLMALVSVAVVAWFQRNDVDERDTSWVWKTLIAPVVAAALLLGLLAYVVTHFELVVGGEPGEKVGLLIILVVSFAAGVMVATVIRTKDPERFERLGGTGR